MLAMLDVTNAIDLPALSRISQVARALQVDERTVRRWVRDGRLESIRLGDGRSAHLRIPRDSVRALLGGSSSSKAQSR